MLRRAPAMRAAATCLGLLVAAGCGEGHPPVDTGTTEVKVTGVVKFEGKPANGGDVIFNPSNAERKVPSAVGKIGPDGTYSLTTLVGGNEVRFDTEYVKARPQLSQMRRYTVLQNGENVIDFDVFGEGDVPRGEIRGKVKTTTKTATK